MKTLLIALAFCPLAAFGQVNKCVIDGKTVYQSMPCPGAGEKVKVNVSPASDGSVDTATWARESAKRGQAIQARMKNETEDHIQSCGGKIIADPQIGMDEADVRCTLYWQSYKYTNVTATAAGVKKQYVFGNGSYLYFLNGKLIASQGQQ